MPSAAAHLLPADQTDQQAEDAQYYRRVLHELIDMGVDLARGVHQQATVQAGGEDLGDGPGAPTVQDTAAAFDRISRAVRRTVALARKIAEPLPPRADTGQQRVAARRRILREVADVIQRRAEGVEAEAMHAELSERLDAPDLEDDIDGRPVAEIIADICRDLGLAAMPGTRPWKRRTPRDIEALCTRAAQPRAVPSPAAVHAAPARAEIGAGPPPLPRDEGADLLRFTFPVRGP